MSKTSRYGFFLLSSIAISVLALLAVTLTTARASNTLRFSAFDIAENAAASIVTLEAANEDLGELSTLLAAARRGPPGPQQAARVAQIRALVERLQDHFREYYAQPAYAAEEQLWPEMGAALDGVLAQAEAITNAAEGHAPRFGGADPAALELAVQRLSQALQGDIRFNTAQIELPRKRIELVRKQLLPLTVALDAVGVLGAALAVLSGVAAVRQALASADANRRLAERRADELETFSARIAHDLLSPLTTVGIGLAIVERNPQKATDAIARSQAALQRVRRMTDGLLEFARAGATPPEGARANVQSVLDDVIVSVTEQARLSSVTLHADDGPNVAARCSPGVLTSLLSNLLNNAIKHMGDSQPREIFVRVTEVGSYVRFEVEDTGPGVPRALQSRLFEPFVRGDHTRAGIGLGLATVKKLAEAHGGAVGLRSAPGYGSVFWFRIPKAAVVIGAKAA